MTEQWPKQPSSTEDHPPQRLARFGPFELDLDHAVLRRQGRAVSMRQQSLRILIYLVEHAGATVSRDELKTAVWPSGTYVEFESGLYAAVNQMRTALGDSASQPYFVETVPRVGYRFISPVQLDEPAPKAVAEQPPLPVAPTPSQPDALPPAAGKHTLALSVTAAVILATAVGALLWLHAGPKAPVLDHLLPFTTGRGSQDQSSFSPDGEMLAFTWKADTDAHSSIYIQRLDATSPIRLSSGAEVEKRPVWSPDGRQIAFLRDGAGPALAIYSMPLLGGGETRRAEFRRGATPWFDWSPNGKWFVVAEPVSPGRSASVVMISAVTGERRVLTEPPAGWRGDSLPSFSADSTRIVFRRTMVESGVEDLYEVPVTGGSPKRLTFNGRTIGYFCISPGGGLLLSASWESSIRTLWWLGPRGAPVRVTPSAFVATAPAISRDGKHLAFSKELYDVNILRINSDGTGPATPLIDSRFPDIGAQYSPDGRHIAFQSSRSGTDDIWICDSDGNNSVRLVEGGGTGLGNPKWSPDGKQIAFEWQRAGKSEIFVTQADGGAPRKIVADEFQNSTPAWSHDGRSLYFSSNRSGAMAIWKVATAGGSPVPVITQHSGAPVESADGQFLYYFRDDLTDGEVWRRTLTGSTAGPDIPVMMGLRQHDWGNWAPSQSGIYFLRPVENGVWELAFRDFQTGATRRVYLLKKLPIWASAGLAVSPDGRTVLFAQIDQNETNIFIQ